MIARLEEEVGSFNKNTYIILALRDPAFKLRFWD